MSTKKSSRTKPDNSTQARTAAIKALGKWQGAFLEALKLTGNITAACRAASVARSWAYDCYAQNQPFAALWDEAIEEATDALEEEARKRAMGEGLSYKFDKSGKPLKHPVTGQPYAERCVSDAMLTLLLKAHRPEKFKDRTETTHRGAVGVVDLSKLTDEQLHQLEQIQHLLKPADDAQEA